MPIVDSQIAEDSQQADGRRWITEKHTDSTGKNHRVTYLAESDFDVDTALNSNVSHIDQRLIAYEISIYIDRVENGENVIGLDYIETTQKNRALQFLIWAKNMVQAENFQALRFAYLVIDPYTEAQINTLLEGTQFENKADKIKLWVAKIKVMKLAMDDSVTAAGEV